MRTRTLMWNTFMTRGTNKCIIMAQYKGKDEDAYIAPNSFEKSYEELGIHSGCQITLIEFRKNMGDSSDDDGEGGEEEHEEMEAEIEDLDEAAEDGEKPAEEDAASNDEADEKPEADEDSGAAAKEGGVASKQPSDAREEASAPADNKGPTAAQQLNMQ